MCYPPRAKSALNLAMNSSALSSIPYISGDANPTDSHISSAPRVFWSLLHFPLSWLDPGSIAGWLRTFILFVLGGHLAVAPLLPPAATAGVWRGSTSLEGGSLKSSSTYTGAALFCTTWLRRYWTASVLGGWINCFLCWRWGWDDTEGRRTAVLVRYLVLLKAFLWQGVFFLMDLDFWSLCSLLWSLVVKFLQAFLAGKSLFPKFKQYIGVLAIQRKACSVVKVA